MLDLKTIYACGSDSLTIPVDLVVVNDNRAITSVEKLFAEADRKLASKVMIVVDQIVPPNDPKVSSEQRKLIAFAQEFNLDYYYGTGMTPALLAEQGLPKGSVVVSCDPEISMVGGLGAYGFCVDPDMLEKAMLTGQLVIPSVKTAEIKLENSLIDGVTVKNAALGILKNLEEDRFKDTVVLLRGEAVSEMTTAQKMILCGMLKKSGAAAVVYDTEAASEDAICVDLSAVRQNAALNGGYSKIHNLALLDPQTVKTVFIGGEYGGTLEAIACAAKILEGKQIPYGLRLNIVPNTSKVYRDAANLGYLTTLNKAGALILNQCASAKIQGRIGAAELMVSNNVHNDKCYAGPEGSRIMITSTPAAAECALTGRIGGTR